MKKSSIIWLVVIIVVIVILGGLWWASMSSSSPSTTTQTTTSTTTGTSQANPTTGSGTGVMPAQPTVAATLTLNNSGGGQFGAFLSASNGMTLYQSTKDSSNVSNCTGACATTWPPYTVSAAVAKSLTASPGVAGGIATIKRADGSLQVTYRGLPLYFYSGDTQAGDTKGEAVNGFTEVAP
jgi:predicted lipoprotein with Yx(FWY)xxD motif